MFVINNMQICEKHILAYNHTVQIVLMCMCGYCVCC